MENIGVMSDKSNTLSGLDNRERTERPHTTGHSYETALIWGRSWNHSACPVVLLFIGSLPEPGLWGRKNRGSEDRCADNSCKFHGWKELR